MTIPVYLNTFQNRSDITHILNTCGFAGLSEFDRYIKAWADTCFHLATRIARHPEPISRNAIRDIYYDALSRFVVPKKKLCG